MRLSQQTQQIIRDTVREVIGGRPAANVSVTSPTVLTAVTPPGSPGPAAVVVTTPGGSGTLAEPGSPTMCRRRRRRPSPWPRAVGGPAR